MSLVNEAPVAISIRDVFSPKHKKSQWEKSVIFAKMKWSIKMSIFSRKDA